MVRGYLLDTDAISLFAPGRKPVTETFSRWMESWSHSLFVSTISIGEIEAGLAKLRRKQQVARADRIDAWFSRLLAAQEDRILGFDKAVAHVYGETLDRAWAAGHDPGFADAAIGATAIRHGLHVVTCNMRHFREFGVTLVDPGEPATFS